MNEQVRVYSNGTLREAVGRIAEEAEYRCKKGMRHALENILILYLFAALFCRIGGRPAAGFYKEHRKLRRRMIRKLGLEKHGIPSYSTFNRALVCIDPGILVSELSEWIFSLLPQERKEAPHLAIDGKALRAAMNKNLTGQSLYIVNVVDVAMKVVIYQFRVGAKKNEMSSIDALITDILQDTNSVVSMDGMGTQKKLLDKIEKMRCTAFLPVKSNHKNFEDAIKECVLECVTKGAKIQYGVDLGSFKEDDIASGVIANTRVSYEEELNPGAGPYAENDDDKADEPDGGSSDEAAVKETAGETDAADTESTSPEETDSAAECESTDAERAGAAETAETADTDDAAAETPEDSADTGATNPGSVKLDPKTLRFFPKLFHYRTDCPAKSEMDEKKNSRLKWVKVMDFYILMEKVHGRLERREAMLLNLTEDGTPSGKPIDIVKLLGKSAKGWENVKAIGVIRRYRGVQVRDPKTKKRYWKITINDVAYIMNTYGEVEEFLIQTRVHWGCEVEHHVLDTVFDEDLHTARTGFSPENNSMITKLVLDLYHLVQNQDEAAGEEKPTMRDIEDRFGDDYSIPLNLIYKKVRKMTEIDENTVKQGNKAAKAKKQPEQEQAAV